MEIGSHSVSHSEYSTSVSTKIRRVLENLAAEESKVGYLNYLLGLMGRNVAKGRSHAICRNDDIQSEIALSKEVLERELAPYRVTSFAYPRGSVTRNIQKLVERSRYSSARTTVVGLNNPDRMNFLSLKCKVWRHYTDVSMMNRWLDRALATEAWLIELFHRVSNDPGDAPEACQLNQLRAHLEYAAEKEVWIDTQHNVVDHTRSSRGEV
jgi:hypothetical protein